MVEVKYRRMGLNYGGGGGSNRPPMAIRCPKNGTLALAVLFMSLAFSLILLILSGVLPVSNKSWIPMINIVRAPIWPHAHTAFGLSQHGPYCALSIFYPLYRTCSPPYCRSLLCSFQCMQSCRRPWAQAQMRVAVRYTIIMSPKLHGGTLVLVL